MWQRRRRAEIVVLAALVAVLFPAGVLSVTFVNRPASASSGVERTVAVAGVAASEVPDEPTTTSTSTVPVTTVPKPSTTTSTTVRSTSTTATSSTATTRKPPATTTTTVPAAVVPTGVWHTEANGVSLRLRIDPPPPAAGQPVTFTVDVASAAPCCTVMVSFGDASSEFMANAERVCSEPSPLTPGAHTYTTSHTYAGPGTYGARVVAMAGDACTAPGSPATDPHWMPWISASPIDACIPVGPTGVCP